MSVEINAIYEGQLHCSATHGPSGMKLVTDAPVDNGGRGEAFSPTDLVATALGTCLLTILGLVAKRNNINVDGAAVHVTKEMAAAPLRRIASLRSVVTMPKGLGKKLSADDRKRLESAVAVCPVKQSLHPDVQTPIEFVYPE
ncbi:MAG: OsmC family protein [Phycisphaerae bacterium]|nr:OsmC family protein [Phycisphaerae bacterium]